MITFVCWVIAAVLADAAWKARPDRMRSIGLALVAVVLLVGSFAMVPSALYLGKVAGRLAMPTGACWFGLAALSFGFWVRRERRRCAAAAVLFVLLTVVGNAPLGGAMLGWLESDYVAADRYDGGPLDAVFVLGGSTTQSASGSARLGDAGDRLLTAARVFRQREVGVLVTSGSTILGIGRQRDVAREAAHILVDMGVSAEAIVEIAAPKNSAQEVVAYKAMAEERNWSRLGIVTSAWHMRRVQALCDRAGLVAEPIPADFRGDAGWDGLLSLIPDANGFRNVQRASWEILGAAVGR